MHRVVVQQRGAPAALGGVARREHGDDVGKLGLGQIPVRPGAPEQIEQRRLVPFLGRSFRDHLLREHVEGRLGNHDAVELAVPGRPYHRRALDQVVPRERKEPPFREAAHRVAGAPDALQQGRDAVRRGDLADQVDVPDVDAELERRRRDEHRELPLPQLLLRGEAHLLGKAAVMRRDALGAEPLGELVRHALGQPPRVDEDERSAVRLDQPDQALVDLLPHLVRHHRLERRAGHLDGEIRVAIVAAVDDGAFGIPRAGEEARHLLDRLLRRRKAEALQAPAAHVVEPFERQGEVGAAPRLEHRVDLVDDEHARAPEHVARALGRQEQIQGLRRRDQDMRR